MSNSEKEKNGITSEIEVTKAKKFVLAFVYILIIGTGIGLFYMSKFNNMERRTVPPAIQDTMKTYPTDFKLEEPTTTPKADVMALSQPSDTLVQEGKKLFTTNCVSCHGANGKGDGVAAAALKPSPRNFTSKTGWVNGSKLSEIYKTLSEGVKGSAMVAFDNFSPTQRFALAQYIRSTFVPNPPTDTKEDLEDLIQTYKLDAVQKNPGQVPVEDAMKLIEMNTQQKYQKILSIMNFIKNDAEQSEGAKIFESVTDNKMRALTTLFNTGEWHNNQKVFIDLVVHEINEDGFNDRVHDLSADQWDNLFNYLNKLFS